MYCAEPLLARHQRVAVVLVFNLTLGEIVGEADVVMRGQQQAGAFSLQPFPDGADLLRCGFLFRQDVVQPEDHQGVGVGEDPLVDRQLVAGLVDALEDGDRVAGGFAGQFLESQRRAVEQFQGAGDALQEVRLVVFRCLVARPQGVADFGHGGEAVVHRGGIALGFPRVAPGPVDADAPLARGVLARDVALVVGACRGQCAHGGCLLTSRAPRGIAGR